MCLPLSSHLFVKVKPEFPIGRLRYFFYVVKSHEKRGILTSNEITNTCRFMLVPFILLEVECTFIYHINSDLVFRL